MPDTTTPLGLVKIGIGESYNTWGNKYNDNQDRLDVLLTARVTTATFSSYQGQVAAALGGKVNNVGDTMTGALRLQNGAGANSGSLYAGNGNSYAFFDGTNWIFNSNNGSQFGIYISYNGNNYNVWHSGNFNPSNYLAVTGGATYSGFAGGDTSKPIIGGSGGSRLLAYSEDGNYRSFGVSINPFVYAPSSGSQLFLMRCDNAHNYGGIRWDGANVRMLVDGNDLVIQSNSPSDERLKKDIVPKTGGVADKLSPVEYEFNKEAVSTMMARSGRRSGLLAQDLQKYLPTAVIEVDGRLFLSSDAAMQIIAGLIVDIKNLQRDVKELQHG